MSYILEAQDYARALVHSTLGNPSTRDFRDVEHDRLSDLLTIEQQDAFIASLVATANAVSNDPLPAVTSFSRESTLSMVISALAEHLERSTAMIAALGNSAFLVRTATALKTDA